MISKFNPIPTLYQKEWRSSSFLSKYLRFLGRNKKYFLIFFFFYQLLRRVHYQAPMYIISAPGVGLLVHYSGSHVSVFPTWVHKKQHCGLCGNFDGEADHVFYSPEGCPTTDTVQLLASYTMGDACFSAKEKVIC